MFCSVLFRPDCAMADAAQIGFLPVIAAGEALTEILGNSVPLRFKWPNDLLLNRKKISGTLMEAGVGQSGLAAWVVAGCGINLQHFPPDTIFPATSVKDELAQDIEVGDMVAAYVARLAAWYSRWQEEGFTPVRDAWLASAHTFDEPLFVESGNEKLTGSFRDLDEHGALVIETDDGPRRITVGDVYFKENGGEE
jgi:BirA family biotin operon repressor/biotin-[acetyl-CoA-carboxylase] ligase